MIKLRRNTRFGHCTSTEPGIATATIERLREPGFAHSLPAILLILGSGFLIGCEAAQEKPGAGKPTEVAEISGELMTIEPVSWPFVARVQGSLVSDEVSTIASKVFGRVVEVHCDLGDFVEQRQKLIRLDDREYQLRVTQAEAQLAQVRAAVGLKPSDPLSSLDPQKSPPVREAKAVLEEAVQQVNRLRNAFSQKAIVATDLEAAQATKSVAEARLNSALNGVREKIALIEVQMAQLELARQELLDTIIEAPFDGKVLRRYVAVGTYVQVGEPLVELARTEVLRYRAAVPERLAQRLEIGQTVRLTLNGQVRETTVARISPALDLMNRSLSFEADVPNGDNLLRSGLFAQADVVLDPNSTAIAIPDSALVRFAGVDKAWRVADGKVSEAVLQVGREVDGMHEVMGGLQVGDKILLSGERGRAGKFVGGSEKLDRPETEKASS